MQSFVIVISGCHNILPLAEFVYNNISSTTTGISLFSTNKGYYQNITVYLERDITLSYTYKFAIDLDKLQDTLKNSYCTIILPIISRCIQNPKIGFPSRTKDIY